MKNNDFEIVYELWKEKKITAEKAAKWLEISVPTFYRKARSKGGCKIGVIRG